MASNKVQQCLLLLLAVIVHMGHSQIPLEMQRMLANISTPEEFMDQILEYDAGESGMDTRQASINTAMKAQFAASVLNEPLCKPRIELVVIGSESSASNVIHFPSCVAVMRCSGICRQLHECRPVRVRTKTFKVMRKIPGDNTLESKQPIDMDVDVHVTCKRDCVVRPEHCDSTIQTHDSAACSCRCNVAPTACPLNKVWSVGRCSCVCRERRQCYDRTRFDDVLCRCRARHLVVRLPRLHGNPPPSNIQCPDQVCGASQVSRIMLGRCECVARPVGDFGEPAQTAPPRRRRPGRDHR